MNKQLLDNVINLTDRMWKGRVFKGLLFGDLGIALLYDFLHQYTKQELFEERAKIIVSKYLPDHFEESNLFIFFPTKYAFGLAGIYSAYNIICCNLGNKESKELKPILEFEYYIYENFLKINSESDLSFFHGAAGQLHYLMTNPNPNKKLLVDLLEHLNKILNVSTLIRRFSNSDGQINISVSNGITGFLFVVLDYYDLLTINYDNTYSILREVGNLLQAYLKERLKTYHSILFQQSYFKDDLMVCLFLLKFHDKTNNRNDTPFVLNCCELILEKIEFGLSYKFEIGQSTGLSGVLECVRSIYLLVRQEKIKNWFGYHHKKLCNIVLESSTNEYITDNTLYDGMSGTLLTILSPEIKDNPKWRKLLLY